MNHIDKTWVYLGMVAALIALVLVIALVTLPRARRIRLRRSRPEVEN